MDKSPILIPVNYPDPDFKVTRVRGKQIIRDVIRKKDIILTPEEWVRQNFIQYLIQVLKYPASLFSIEKEIRLPALTKRCDIVVYRDAKPWMIIECKEPKVIINQKVLQQILTYNMALQTPFLVLTNGPRTYAIERAGSTWQYLSALPKWA